MQPTVERSTTPKSATALPDFFEKLAAEDNTRRQRDVQLWREWKDSGEDPERFRPLLQQFKPLIRSQANRWAGNVEIPPAAVHAEFNKQFLHAMRTYDPNRGAALNTWAISNMRKATRFITTNQNTARIGERRVYKVGQFDAAVAELDQELGREPTSQEIADHMGWSEAEVVRLQTERRRTLLASGPGGDSAELFPSREAEVLRLVKFELAPEERLVYDYTVGEGGKPALRPGEIAQRLNMSPSKVTRLRNSITAKIDRYTR